MEYENSLIAKQVWAHQHKKVPSTLFVQQSLFLIFAARRNGIFATNRPNIFCFPMTPFHCCSQTDNHNNWYCLYFSAKFWCLSLLLLKANHQTNGSLNLTPSSHNNVRGLWSDKKIDILRLRSMEVIGRGKSDIFVVLAKDPLFVTSQETSFDPMSF